MNMVRTNATGAALVILPPTNSLISTKSYAAGIFSHDHTKVNIAVCIKNSTL